MKNHKVLSFTMKLNKYIICQRFMHIPIHSEIDENKISKIALLIDNFLGLSFKGKYDYFNLLIIIECEEEVFNYELPVYLKRGDKINIKPIMEDIRNIIIDL